MSAVASPATCDLSILSVLLPAFCEVLNADLEIEDASLLLFIARKGGVPAKSILPSTYRRPREALRKAGLIVWKVGIVVLTDEGAAVVERIATAAAEAGSHKEVPGS